MAKILNSLMDAQDPEQLKNLNEATDLLRDLKINSAHLVDIILDTEDEFDIEIENDEAESMLTLDDVLSIIEKKTAANWLDLILST